MNDLQTDKLAWQTLAKFRQTLAKKSLNGVKNLDIGVADVLSLQFVKRGLGKYDIPSHWYLNIEAYEQR